MALNLSVMPWVFIKISRPSRFSINLFDYALHRESVTELISLLECTLREQMSFGKAVVSTEKL